MSTPDMFDGIFDNSLSGRREVWQDGTLRRYAQRNAVGYADAPWTEMHKAWGSYPDLPANANQLSRPLESAGAHSPRRGAAVPLKKAVKE